MNHPPKHFWTSWGTLTNTLRIDHLHDSSLGIPCVASIVNSCHGFNTSGWQVGHFSFPFFFLSLFFLFLYSFFLSFSLFLFSLSRYFFFLYFLLFLFFSLVTIFVFHSIPSFAAKVFPLIGNTCDFYLSLFSINSCLSDSYLLFGWFNLKRCFFFFLQFQLFPFIEWKKW